MELLRSRDPLVPFKAACEVLGIPRATAQRHLAPPMYVLAPTAADGGAGAVIHGARCAGVRQAADGHRRGRTQVPVRRAMKAAERTGHRRGAGHQK